MTLDIRSLGELEDALIAKVCAFAGTIEQKSEQLEKSGIYEQYSEIYDSYIDLIQSNVEGPEALKRALFLCWYEQTEPTIYTGLSGLAAKESTHIIFEHIDAQIRSGDLDGELDWMTQYYYEVGEWVFEPYLHLEYLKRFLLARGFGFWSPAGLRVESFLNRGQMGDYWASVVTSRSSVEP